MKRPGLTPDAYVAALPEPMRGIVMRLRTAIASNLPAGFEETIGYNMLAYVVPHSRYPGGYHVDPTLPLPFISIAAQARHVAVYHMGLQEPRLLAWLARAWAEASRRRLDVGKACIRMAPTEDIPYALFAELAKQMSVDRWIAVYEAGTQTAPTGKAKPKPKSPALPKPKSPAKAKAKPRATAR